MDKQLILISGISGAGKSTASIFLEDMGYRCIDQYPVEILKDLVELLENDESPRYEKVALTISLSDLEKYENLLTNSALKPTLILLDCDKEEIINRYKFTRRVHPLMISNVADTLGEAIDIEKAIVNKYKDRNCHIIDTTLLSKKQHREKIEKIIKGQDTANLAISFVSFGFKNGAPKDADIVIDVRILDNPFYDEKLRTKNGFDQEVIDYVLKPKKTINFLKKVVDYLNFTFEAYGNEEKRHITVAIGCTGGQHRSVTIANYLYEFYKEKYNTYIHHREIKEEK